MVRPILKPAKEKPPFIKIVYPIKLLMKLVNPWVIFPSFIELINKYHRTKKYLNTLKQREKYNISLDNRESIAWKC